MDKVDKIRVDKNITINFADFDDRFAEDAMLVKSLLLYFAWKQQNSLFDSNVLDVEEFCRVMLYKRENIVCKRKITAGDDKPLRKVEIIGGKEVERVFDSQLEYALGLLLSRNMVYSKEARSFVDDSGSRIERHVMSSINFISELTFDYVTTKSNRSKIIYKYTLAPSFLANLSLYFTKVGVNNFGKLRKSNSDSLYMFLLNLKDILRSQNTNSTDTVRFEELCKIAKITIKDNNNRKFKLIKKFSALTELTKLNARLTFKVSENMRWSYQPVITFVDEEKTDNKEERLQILLHNFMIELYAIISENLKITIVDDSDAETKIIALCNNMGLCPEEKIEAYKNAQIRTFAEPKEECFANAYRIPALLKGVRTKDDIFGAITNKALYYVTPSQYSARRSHV